MVLQNITMKYCISVEIYEFEMWRIDEKQPDLKIEISIYER